MREIGSLGGKAGGKRRYKTVRPAKRHLIAIKGARARWNKPPLTREQEAAHLETWDVGVAHGAGWPRPRSRQDAEHSRAPIIAPVDKAFGEILCRDEEFQAAVASFQDQPKVQSLMRALVSTKHRRWSVPRLAARVGLSPAEFVAIWRETKFSEVMTTILGRLPEIAADTVDDAKSSSGCCPRCGGWGTITRGEGEAREEKICVQCGGSGVVRRPGESAARKVVFEAVGTLERESGIRVAAGDDRPSLESVIEEIEQLERVR